MWLVSSKEALRAFTFPVAGKELSCALFGLLPTGTLDKRAVVHVIGSTILFRLAAIPKLRDSPINSNSALHGSIRHDKGTCEMRTETKLFLVRSAANGIGEEQVTFRTGETITRSGIYQVIHRKHRL